MKTMLLGTLLVLAAFSACTPTVQLQIENADGRMRYYDTFDAIEGHTEKWTCRQMNVGRLTAEYHCQARLWR